MTELSASGGRPRAVFPFATIEIDAAALGAQVRSAAALERLLVTALRAHNDRRSGYYIAVHVAELGPPPVVKLKAFSTSDPSEIPERWWEEPDPTPPPDPEGRPIGA